MNNQIGSVWNKWDFHVHTPYSILNNNYGFNPFEDGDEKKFDTYVQTLFTKAIEKNVVAIGITDYFMIEGYKRIRQDYLGNPEKMRLLFPDEGMRNRVANILVFPNIELRLKIFIGEEANSVNYHVIFSDKVPIQEIEDNFLQELKFNPRAGQEKSLTRSNIEQYGKKIKEENGAKGSDLLVGLKHISVTDENVIKVLKENPVFSGRYLITIPVDEDLSKVSWNGRDYSSRRNLYQQCHCLLTSNKGTAKWALAEGREEAQIKEFDSIKPCIWGSDAHEYERMFNPANDRFCWIKADPTFEGLLQILYEPKERVVVQKEKPDEKDIHQIIGQIQFEDEKFQTEPIVFNDSLTCIIGGKSTGKSLLLQQLATAIDAEYAETQEKVSQLSRKRLPVKTPHVLWKDGTSDSRKIIYIPQTFLNRTIDDPEKATAINSIIANVLKQEKEIAAAYQKLITDTKKIKKQVRTKISEYCEKTEELSEIIEEIKAEGTPDSFRNTLESLELKRTELANGNNISQAEIDRFAQLEESIRTLSGQQEQLKKELASLTQINNPAVVIPGYFLCGASGEILHSFNEDFPNFGSNIQKVLLELTDMVQPKWRETLGIIKKELVSQIQDLGKKLGAEKSEYSTLKRKVDQNEQIQTLSKQIAVEREKLGIAEDRQRQKEKEILAITRLRVEIISSQREYLDAYTQYCQTVIATGTRKQTSLTFDAKPIWKTEEFQSTLGNIFDNRNFAKFFSVYGMNLSALTEESYGENLLTNLWDAMTDLHKEGSLTIKAAYTTESALQLLFEDWYNVHYIVKSGNDTIDSMSPGKKALVLLELLISLEESKCPILIDQPEDDLDNRSVYDDLVKYIKQKKKERQIIVVTHNANVVLGADAEEVIIANQDGKGTENAEKRFEYRSGSIENDRIELDTDGRPLKGILNQHGIQTQICDILEGGPSAFELRKNKYMTIVHTTATDRC